MGTKLDHRGIFLTFPEKKSSSSFPEHATHEQHSCISIIVLTKPFERKKPTKISLFILVKSEIAIKIAVHFSLSLGSKFYVNVNLKSELMKERDASLSRVRSLKWPKHS